ncbi:MAG TPA: DUF397 domain-containing protein [Pseudonocardiaceae bacterium]|jgi:hypothetical protein|nr:DUF397 domain-containing protein [Pseudonocardiaceae bacterium]
MHQQRTWRKSTYSGSNTDCVEIAWDAAVTTAIRDSKRPEAGSLALPVSAFRTFIGQVAADR